MEWLNQVDASYRANFRELNELHFQRFDARLEQRLTEVRSELRAELKEQKADLMKWMFIYCPGPA